jgi:di/tricarboxylate transporter
MSYFSPPLGHHHWIPAVIFLATYILIAIESGRGSHLDRTAAAFCGAVAMVLARVLSLDEAYKIIDWNTLIFLLGMMILVAHFQISGFFDWVAIHIALVAPPCSPRWRAWEFSLSSTACFLEVKPGEEKSGGGSYNRLRESAGSCEVATKRVYFAWE